MCQRPLWKYNITLLNKVESRIRVPIEKVMSELKEDAPIAEIPVLANNVVTKRCAFKIKINSCNTNMDKMLLQKGVHLRLKSILTTPTWIRGLHWYQVVRMPTHGQQQ